MITSRCVTFVLRKAMSKLRDTKRVLRCQSKTHEIVLRAAAGLCSKFPCLVSQCIATGQTTSMKCILLCSLCAGFINKPLFAVTWLVFGRPGFDSRYREVFSLHRPIQNFSDRCSRSNQMGPAVKEAGTWCCPHISKYWRGRECVVHHLHCLYAPHLLDEVTLRYGN